MALKIRILIPVKDGRIALKSQNTAKPLGLIFILTKLSQLDFFIHIIGYDILISNAPFILLELPNTLNMIISVTDIITIDLLLTTCHSRGVGDTISSTKTFCCNSKFSSAHLFSVLCAVETRNRFKQKPTYYDTQLHEPHQRDFCPIRNKIQYNFKTEYAFFGLSW